MLDSCPSCSKEVDVDYIDGQCPYCKVLLEVDFEETSPFTSKLRELRISKRYREYLCQREVDLGEGE